MNDYSTGPVTPVSTAPEAPVPAPASPYESPPGLFDLPCELLAHICTFLDRPGSARAACVALRAACKSALPYVIAHKARLHELHGRDIKLAMDGQYIDYFAREEFERASAIGVRWCHLHLAMETDLRRLCEVIEILVMCDKDPRSAAFTVYIGPHSPAVTGGPFMSHFERLIRMVWSRSEIYQAFITERFLPLLRARHGELDPDTLTAACYGLMEFMVFGRAQLQQLAEFCSADTYATYLLTADWRMSNRGKTAARKGIVYLHSELSDRFVIPVVEWFDERFKAYPAELGRRAKALLAQVRDEILSSATIDTSPSENASCGTLAGYVFMAEERERFHRADSHEIGQLEFRCKCKLLMQAYKRLGLWESARTAYTDHYLTSLRKMTPCATHYLDKSGAIVFTFHKLLPPYANLYPTFTLDAPPETRS